jgi:hypothetical protein
MNHNENIFLLYQKFVISIKNFIDFFQKILSPQISLIFRFAYEIFLCQAINHAYIIEDLTENTIDNFESFDYLALPKFSLDLHKNKSTITIEVENFLKNIQAKKNENAFYCFTEDSALMNGLLKHDKDVDICLM